MQRLSLRFEEQEHQEDCVRSIMDALEKRDGSLQLKTGHKLSGLYPTKPENRLDIVMETGTGKTYTYIKTIFEINRKFGKTKFIIIVPRTSIRLGVEQNIKQTANHFNDLYGRHLRYVSYSGDDPGNAARNFILTTDLSVLIITNSSFNSKDNRINRHTETLYGNTTIWDTIINISPVVIMDEPHLLKGTKTKEYLENLRTNSLVMRFGATYPPGEEDGASNVVYILNSIDALNKKLVKRIMVSTVNTQAEESDIQVVDIRSRKNFRILYMINKQQRKTIVRLGDDLGAVTGILQYYGQIVSNIKSKEIILNNGERLYLRAYDLTDYEIRQMVAHTIDLHFKHERKMFAMGIKTLSLFFIPNVNDFRGDGRIKKIFEKEYAKKRQEVLRNGVNEEYRKYLDMDYKDGKLCVHEGYFSGDKVKTREGAETEGVEKILNDKESLLSLNEPLRFIFSVWALQEGWDNPNVFNICKLSHSSVETSRRQQVGRGLRIAVNGNGFRMTDARLGEGDKRCDFHYVNGLNMVVSAYESTFIEDIQHEIHDASPGIVSSKITLVSLNDAGLSDEESSALFMGLLKGSAIDKDGMRLVHIPDFLRSNKDLFSDIKEDRLEEIVDKLRDTNRVVIDNNRRKVHVRYNKWKEFKVLWEQLNREAHMVYKGVDEDAIIRKVCQKFEETDIPADKTVIMRKFYDSENDQIVDYEMNSGDDANYFQKHAIHHYIMKIAKEKNWPIKFLLKLFGKIDVAKFKSSPEKAEYVLINTILETIHDAILEKVEYRFAETTIFANGLQDENKRLIRELEHTKLGKVLSDKSPPSQFLYDSIPYDSKIELKSILRDSMKYTDKNHTQRIEVFAKLPHIYIPTPHKKYNPDFAYVISNGDEKTLFLVVETKGYDKENEIREDERMKIKYGEKFFNSLQKVLPDGVELCFKKRLNRDNMSEILRCCCSK